jgi:cellulose synthase/poly-beta-1,6-N-acetylglucosamine synthase-like glycosyltransferase
MAIVRTTILWYDNAIVGYFALVMTIYLSLMLISAAQLARATAAGREHMPEVSSGHGAYPSIALILTAYNEETSIADSVRSLLGLRYDDFEILVVNDGSVDHTMEQLTREFHLRRIRAAYCATLPAKPVRGVYISDSYPRLTVIEKDNGGKADALNAGINLTQSTLICSLDADSVLEPDSIRRLAQPVIDDPRRVVGVGGLIRIVNDVQVERGSVMAVRLPRRPLPVFQTIEYLRAFLGGRVGWSALNSLLIISGAFGLYRRDVVVDVGGFRSGSMAEDAELVARTHHSLGARSTDYRMVFVPDPICWTETPESLRVLRRQRRRWHQGLAETLLAHHEMLFRPRYGFPGMLGYPYFLFIELLAPVIEASGYVILPLALVLGILNWQVAALLIGVALIYGLTLSIGAIVLEELSGSRYTHWNEVLRLCAFSLLENVGYRQLTLLWRLEGLLDLLRHRSTWGTMERRGLGVATAQPHSAAV